MLPIGSRAGSAALGRCRGGTRPLAALTTRDVTRRPITVRRPAAVHRWGQDNDVTYGPITVRRPAAVHRWGQENDVIHGPITVRRPAAVHRWGQENDVIHGPITVRRPAAVHRWGQNDVIHGPITMIFLLNMSSDKSETVFCSSNPGVRNNRYRPLYRSRDYSNSRYDPRFLQIRLGSESCDQISASPNRPKRAKSRDETAGSLFTRVYTLVEFSQTKRCFFPFLKQNIQRQMINQHHYHLHNTIHISLKTR